MWGSTNVESQVQVFDATKATFVRGGDYANENYLNHPDGIYVKQGTVPSFFRKGLVGFDLSDYVLNNVGRALLKLYCYKVEKPSEASLLSAHGMNDNWDPNSAT